MTKNCDNCGTLYDNKSEDANEYFCNQCMGILEVEQ